MRMYDLIVKKREGYKLSEEEIKYIVDGFTSGKIPDYQMSSFLMAVYLKGMDNEETTNLTIAMAQSGECLDLSSIKGIKVDKHSTGGVGDKTSLIVGPILAALGIPIAKMSGRGLGHTGGTIDKLESIDGFNVSISKEQFIQNVNEIKLSIVGQTANLAPADKKIYALRDVTATVDNYSLISSSIMSKKLAAGADVIVLDVKCGSGAFMKSLEEAKMLAKTMVDIGKMSGRDTYAVITDMNEPLGQKVGNGLEVIEAIEVLNGGGDNRLIEVSVELAAYMYVGAKAKKLKMNFENDLFDLELGKAKKLISNVIIDKSALNKLAQFIESQGGNKEYIYNTDLFPKAKIVVPVYLNKSGYLKKCNTTEIGIASLILGGGRETKDSIIDLTVGIDIKKHLGEFVSINEPIAYIHGNDSEKVKNAGEIIINAYEVSDEKVNIEPCIKYAII